ncbi:hypothetical protein [Streptomyces sp.]|uniref:hypothetical protein n=1 Tax=Streptomyces sp. TaxID=1931 RepID=UPI002810A543|nr:hypothetical protein [Streptomyces sp.]
MTAPAQRQITACLTALFGADVVALLDTPAKRTAAYRICRLLAASRDGAEVARAWMVGMNPRLDHHEPITAIAAGCAGEVEAAARAYLDGSAP